MTKNQIIAEIRRKEQQLRQEEGFYNMVKLQQFGAALYHKNNMTRLKNQISSLKRQLKNLGGE